MKEVYNKALATHDNSVIESEAIRDKVDYICRNISNRAGARLLMACLLAKVENPSVDPRKPYTEIGTEDSFSGRTLDEGYLTAFITQHSLPCNPTTAFLTPTLRNISQPLTTDMILVGRPRELYIKVLELLAEVAEDRIDAEVLFIETVRILVLVREEKLGRMKSLLNTLERTKDGLALSSEQIVSLISQHLACRGASRLPVLIVAAAYQSAGNQLREYARPLFDHHAADLQTKSIGDVEVCLEGDNAVVTVYEMKMKRVTIEDIDAALTKIFRAEKPIHNYIFITTDPIAPVVAEYASTLYDDLGGIEITILDCIGFLRHFLHFFHRARTVYLEYYQNLVLAEPDSAVSSTLKEAFLALRQAAETRGE
jgi:hypothetical protein